MLHRQLRIPDVRRVSQIQNPGLRLPLCYLFPASPEGLHIAVHCRFCRRAALRAVRLCCFSSGQILFQLALIRFPGSGFYIRRQPAQFPHVNAGSIHSFEGKRLASGNIGLNRNYPVFDRAAHVFEDSVPVDLKYSSFR